MMKKILGGLLLIEAALIIIGSVVNGTFMSDQGSAAATYGTFVGTMLPVITNIFGSIFLFRFDRACKQSYIDGFNTRKKQCPKFVYFIVIYFLQIMIVGAGVGAKEYDNYFLSYIIAVLPHIIPLLIFVSMICVYALPFWACHKNFKLDLQKLNYYISVNETFYSYSKDNFVIASDKVIFFPKHFCIIPYDSIASTKLYNAIEQDIIFNLTNGKKIKILANKEKYNGVLAAIEANKNK